MVAIPCGFESHHRHHVGAKSALLRRLFVPAARKTSSARSLAPPSQLRPATLGSQLAGRPFAARFVDRAERLHGPLQPAANVDPRGRSAGRKLPCDGGAPHQKSPCARSAQGLSAIKELLLQGVACGGNTTGTALSKGSRGSYPAVVSRPPDSGTPESLLNAVGRKPAQKALDRQLLGHQLAIGAPRSFPSVRRTAMRARTWSRSFKRSSYRRS